MLIVAKALPIAPDAAAYQTSLTVDAGFLENLDSLDLSLTEDYYSSFCKHSPATMTMAAGIYLAEKKEQNRSLLCPEMPLSRDWVNLLRLVVSRGPCWSRSAVAVVHAGHSGCIAPLHFDWDHTWVIHACLLGRKRLFFFPPQAGWLLCPVVNSSALCLPRFSEADRREVIHLLGGHEIILEAGDAVLFPSMFWHGVYYERPSLSVSVRFEAWPGGRPFAALPRSWLLQRLIALYFQRGYGREAADFLLRYLKAFFKPQRWHTSYRAVNALCRSALLDLGEGRGVEEWVGENFSAELLLAAQELKIWYNTDAGSVKVGERGGLRDVAAYLFEDTRWSMGDNALKLARHAMATRQGLPPKRGLIMVERSQGVI